MPLPRVYAAILYISDVMFPCLCPFQEFMLLFYIFQMSCFHVDAPSKSLCCYVVYFRCHVSMFMPLPRVYAALCIFQMSCFHVYVPSKRLCCYFVYFRCHVSMLMPLPRVYAAMLYISDVIFPCLCPFQEFMLLFCIFQMSCFHVHAPSKRLCCYFVYFRSHVSMFMPLPRVYAAILYFNNPHFIVRSKDHVHYSEVSRRM